MVKLIPARTILLLSFIVSIALFASSCGAIGASYTPLFVPVTFAIDSSGNISITGNASIVTEIGTFALTAGVANTLQPADNTILLIIRHQQNGSIVDTAYQINTQQQVVVVVDGRTTIDVTTERVMIDASQGDVNCIEVKDINDSENTCGQVTQPPTTSNVTVTTQPQIIPTVAPSFHCPSAGQVSAWMGTNASQIGEYCAFHAGDVQGQTLSGVTCTNQDGGTTIEYTPVDQPKTLVVADCNGGQLPEIYGFTIRFIAAYPSSGPYSANVCAIAQAARARQGPNPIPSDWIVQANC